MGANLAVEDSRRSENVDFVGIGESVQYETRSSAPFIHRRIIFTTPDRLEGTNPQFNTSLGFHRGPARDIELVPLAWVSAILESYSNPENTYLAGTKSGRVKVLSDEVFNISPASDGAVRSKRWWKPLHEDVTYDDSSDPLVNAWARPNTGGGNVYIADVYSNREQGEVLPAVVSGDLVAYWKESR